MWEGKQKQPLIIEMFWSSEGACNRFIPTQYKGRKTTVWDCEWVRHHLWLFSYNSYLIQHSFFYFVAGIPYFPSLKNGPYESVNSEICLFQGSVLFLCITVICLSQGLHVIVSVWCCTGALQHWVQAVMICSCGVDRESVLLFSFYHLDIQGGRHAVRYWVLN